MTNKTPMTILEQIQAGFDMNYSATIKEFDDEIHNVVGIRNGRMLLRNETDLTKYWLTSDINERCKIIGFKFMGELGGNEYPTKGQKFKVKLTGQIVTCNGYTSYSIFTNQRPKEFLNTEIEPIFTD